MRIWTKMKFPFKIIRIKKIKDKWRYAEDGITKIPVDDKE